ncbi:hypothetical protein PFICI_03873 [Pestalotiopsis fici W106-1]|uniref:Erythromycin esterase n=1 Tax=Pestalotiopsis fici (strain W106-1 / CGMCC3.15140) TaxID=1229662 RepID=W3XIF3_PESFW|nr:uncharacterized protein PFICI_03873 [Pestalotiopsis fici W106-1]ETS85848.1 hypothetical protein PFICI_03873 [Pestalotiopsis fici W106-1]
MEGDEEPTAQQPQSLDAIMSSPMPPKPTTPRSVAPMKPAMSEMHPSRVHQTMAPPSSGLKFGFVDINANARTREQPSGITQTTPSKTPRAPSTDFTFRVASPTSGELGLGPEAQRMMDELREQAAVHKARIIAERQQEKLEKEQASQDARKIASAKGKMGRFSDVHLKEFKKMDSIATPGTHTVTKAFNFTPLKSGMKRSQSKANLDEPASTSRKAPATTLDSKSHQKPKDRPEIPAKRVKQRVEDDASSARPVSRDGSNIPRPKSSGSDSIRSGIPRSQTMTNIMTPTKASAAKGSLNKTPSATLAKSSTKPDLTASAQPSNRSKLGSLIRSPTRSDLSSLLKSPGKTGIDGSLKKSATTNSLGTSTSIPSLVQTPGRFDRVKSILKRQISVSKSRTQLPHFGSSTTQPPKTPGKSQKDVLAVPMTTPGQKFGKHVEFTPDTKQATLTQNSPSPMKSGIPRSRSFKKIPAPNFQSLSAAVSVKSPADEVTYPDLSAYQEKPEEDIKVTVDSEDSSVLPNGVPGTFTFRSDHTIRFHSASPNGFGGAAGQASLRQVRASVGPGISMPGAYPTINEPASPNKENKDPGVISGIAHGMSNKKRHRAVWDDEEVKTGISHGLSNKKRGRADSDDEQEQDEGAHRGAKKLRKNPTAAEGQALVAPRLTGTPSPKKTLQPQQRFASTSGTPSPQKKGISMSRLNMLARPKIRK